MKTKWIAVLSLALLAALAGAQQKPAAKPAATSGMKTDQAKQSYAIGVTVGRNLKRQLPPVDMDAFVSGLRDALKDQKLQMSEADVRDLFERFRTEMGKKQAEQMKQQAAAAKAMGAENQRKGDAFLAENKAKPGVVTLPDGLQYKILTAGTGKKPAATDTVSVNYKGTLIDGTEFDSSYKRGQPAEFPVTGVIKGWTEALQLMPVGSKWQLVVPAALAYGERGAGPQIGPNATLIFEVELLSIK
jgi:FKBP-type peptidyl-prolyl cis-trans isomerase FklB